MYGLRRNIKFKNIFEFCLKENKLKNKIFLKNIVLIVSLLFNYFNYFNYLGSNQIFINKIFHFKFMYKFVMLFHKSNFLEGFFYSYKKSLLR